MKLIEFFALHNFNNRQMLFFSVKQPRLFSKLLWIYGATEHFNYIHMWVLYKKIISKHFIMVIEAHLCLLMQHGKHCL